jgi:hypothetical protein
MFDYHTVLWEKMKHHKYLVFNIRKTRQNGLQQRFTFGYKLFDIYYYSKIDKIKWSLISSNLEIQK